MTHSTVNYASYLKLSQLLSAQCPLSEPMIHDEFLFIVIHQIHELAFKLLLHELKKIKKKFIDYALHDVITTFNRCTMILRALHAQLQILETMKSTDFAKFRAYLGTASGYQSKQFQEMNELIGDQNNTSDLFKTQILKQSHEKLSLTTCFNLFMKQACKNLCSRDTPFKREIDLILYFYNHHADFSHLFESMIDFDAAMQTWRYGHVKLAERMIGTKIGTGGSIGINYLTQSIHQKYFSLLWEMRNHV